jgi:hypothetical protein
VSAEEQPELEAPAQELGAEELARCPKCGGELEQGYGLAGGGCGVYTFCTVDGCDFFDKTQDRPE